MNWKETYTKVFLKQLEKSTDEATVQQYMYLWWQNTRTKSSGGLRLTEAGYNVLQDIGIEVYDIPYPPDMIITAQIIVFLDKFINCPYYLNNRSIVVTDQRKAVELTLFSGDVRKYGLIKAMKRQENS
jgi:hypothetical protein